MTVIKLRDYDFTTNDGDEPVLMFSGIGGLAKDPFFTLQNSDAFLFRSADMPRISLEHIPDSVREKIEQSPQILVCELDADGEPQQVYDAPVLKNA